MLSKWQWILVHLKRTLWIRAAFYIFLALTTVTLAGFADAVAPLTIPFDIGTGSVEAILNILASTMLAVTTFSLTVMVAAYGAATANVTPRATKLIRQDTTTHTVLATFIGSFLFSLVAIIALKTGIYGTNGRLLIFLSTLMVVAIIVITMLRWIEHLSLLGRVGATTDRVEVETTAALQQRLSTPCLGCHCWGANEPVPDSAINVLSAVTGYVQHVDTLALQAWAEKHHATLYIHGCPGSFVHPGQPLAALTCDDSPPQDINEKIRTAFTIKAERTFDQDPRFGLSVMAEIASRALSPAVNDPGTAIDVIGRGVRLLSRWQSLPALKDDELSSPRLKMRALSLDDLFEDIFRPIARDGASLVEVQIRLQKAFIALASLGQPELTGAAIRHSGMAMAYAEQGLTLAAEKALIRELAQRLVNLQTAQASF